MDIEARMVVSREDRFKSELKERAEGWIDMEKLLLFDECFRELLLNGYKTMTARCSKHGEAGDAFSAFGIQFCFTMVRLASLREVISFWPFEGFESAQQCEQYLNEKYPHTNMLWLHSFQRKEIGIMKKCPRCGCHEIIYWGRWLSGTYYCTRCNCRWLYCSECGGPHLLERDHDLQLPRE